MATSIKWWSGLVPFRIMAQATLQPDQVSKVSFGRMLAAEHSPVRAVDFIVEMDDCLTFVSVHLVRHHTGIDHCVRSNRVDRIKRLDEDEDVTRMTPIDHTIKANAQALINVSRKRLCGQASPETREQWGQVVKAMVELAGTLEGDERYAVFDLVNRMVPECVYRNGLCAELRTCSAGPTRVTSHYEPWPGVRAGQDDDWK